MQLVHFVFASNKKNAFLYTAQSVRDCLAVASVYFVTVILSILQFVLFGV